LAGEFDDGLTDERGGDAGGGGARGHVPVADEG